ncbi:hypothetical protein quinque_007588 [Culex quinquefasciatus]
MSWSQRCRLSGTPPPDKVPVKRKRVEELVAEVPTPGTPPKVPVGVPVKRKVFRERAHQDRKNNHTVISKNCGCILRCSSKLSRDRRLEINQAYWTFFVEKCRIAEVHFKSSGHRSNQKDEQEFRQTGLELNPEDQPDCVEQSEDSNDEDEASCKVCATWLEHRGAAIASRVQYDQDRVISGDLVVSVDLEKVIQLPRMDRFKEVMFAKRIVALNETFAPLGGGQNGPVQAILWNETTSGRKAPDIMSTFTKHMEFNSTVKRIIYWLDNCASQNKNWDMLLHMILLVNSTWIAAERVTFKYLESGHTFMTADSFHASVERKMRKHQGGELHNFDDFVDCVKGASVEVEPVVTVMNYSDFFEPTVCFKPSVFQKKKTRPYLADIKEIRFDRGSYRLLYKGAI